jgi:hypothetical protein
MENTKSKTGKREGEERKREKNHKKTVDGLHANTKCQSDSHHRIHFSLWLYSLSEHWSGLDV